MIDSEFDYKNLSETDFNNHISNNYDHDTNPSDGAHFADLIEKRQEKIKQNQLEKSLVAEADAAITYHQNNFLNDLRRRKITSLEDVAPYITEHVNKYGPVHGTMISDNGIYSSGETVFSRNYNFLGKSINIEARADSPMENLEIMEGNLKYCFSPHNIEVNNGKVTIKK